MDIRDSKEVKRLSKYESLFQKLSSLPKGKELTISVADAIDFGIGNTSHTADAVRAAVCREFPGEFFVTSRVQSREVDSKNSYIKARIFARPL